MRILRRKNEWNRPVKTVLAAKRDRRRGNIAHLPRHLGQSHDAAEGTRVVDDVRVQRIRNGVTTLSGSNGKPIPLGDLSVVSTAGDRCGAAVLLRSVDPIGEPVTGGNSVKLSRWLVVPRAPGLAAIYADGRALIDAQDNSLRICGIDPHRMVVIAARSAFDRRESMPAVRRAVQILLRHVDRIRILWVHENFAHVPIPFDPAIRRGFFPSCSAIVRTIEPAILFFRFKNQVNAPAASRRCDRHTRPAPVSAGKSMLRNLRPGNALVGGFVKPAARAKRSPLLPRLSYAVPKRREDHARIARFETEVHGAGYIVLEQNSPPRASAVNGPKNAALLVRSEAVTHGSHEHDVRIAWVHKDARNVPRVRKADVLPRLSAIRRFVDAISVRNVGIKAVHSGTHVNDA